MSDSPHNPRFLAAVLAIAARDLRGLFFSPLGWSLLAFVQFVIGIVFVIQLQVFLDPPRVAAASAHWGLTRIVAAPLFNWTGFLLVLVIPVLTMRSLSEEQRRGTLPLLLGAPVHGAGIALGKFLALVAYVAIQVGLVTLLPLLLLFGGGLDTGLLAAQALGLTLLGSFFASVGLALSSMTRQPAAAAISTLALLFVLWILSWRGPGDSTSDLASWIHYLSWQLHLDRFLRGWVDSADVGYFVLLTALGVIVAAYRLERMRRSDA